MPHTKPIRKFSKPQAGLKGPLGRYIIQIAEPELEINTRSPDVERSKKLNNLNNYFLALKRGRKGRMRLINLEFKTFDKEKEESPRLNHFPPLTTTLTFSDFLCKWCLTYVGQRRQFCSADCASQFRICQRRREQRQDLNISVDYYGNVKLSIQGLQLQSGEDGGIPVSKSLPTYGGRRGRRRKRCRNCAKLLKDDSEEEFCDETCQSMDTERSKKEDFVNIFQQKETAERRRIRKWLLDAQDNYSKQQGDTDTLHGEGFKDPDPPVRPTVTYDWDTTSVHSAKYSLPIMRTNQSFLPDIQSARKTKEVFNITSGPAALDPLPMARTPRTPITVPEYTKPSKDSPTRSGGPSYAHNRSHYVQDTSRINKNEIVKGGTVTLNPTPLRRVPVKHERPRHMASNGLADSYDSDKKQVMVDLKWIPKFYG